MKLGTLRHRNIIGLVGFSETKENFYLVYEMVLARPLSEVVEGQLLVCFHQMLYACIFELV